MANELNTRDVDKREEEWVCPDVNRGVEPPAPVVDPHDPLSHIPIPPHGALAILSIRLLEVARHWADAARRAPVANPVRVNPFDEEPKSEDPELQTAA